MISFQKYSRELLRPILKNPKCSFLYTISSNMLNIVGSKYINYCKIEKVTLNKENKQGNVYMIIYNSATSFYINNNKDYIMEKINTLFGYKAVLNLYLKEIPIAIKNEKKEIKINKNFSLGIKGMDDNLNKSLNELGSTIFLEQ